jgi:hypothetical protein
VLQIAGLKLRNEMDVAGLPILVCCITDEVEDDDLDDDDDDNNNNLLKYKSCYIVKNN